MVILAILSKLPEENNMTEIDYQVTIDTTERGERVFVDKFDEGVLWLSIQVRGGGAHVTIDRDEALKMLEAMHRILKV